MTKAQRNQVKRMIAEGASPVAIANELRVPLDEVIAMQQRGVLGRAADAVAEVVRPALPKGKPVSDIELCVRATRKMNGQYEATAGGGTRRDGSPAPASRLDPAFANRNASPAAKRRLRSGL